MKLLVVLLVGLWGQQSFGARGGEPLYCQPNVFLKKEIPVQVQGRIKRLHLFKVGSVQIAGLAVGDSDAKDVARFADSWGAHANVNYCTWYLNKGNTTAEQIFTHSYVTNPIYQTPVQAAQEFTQVLGPYFSQTTPINFISCLEQGFLELGCNGQKHRGPSAFGMILAFSGCSPKNAQTIVDQLWGLNGVAYEVRQAIIQSGYELGNRYPEARLKIQNLFSMKNPRR